MDVAVAGPGDPAPFLSARDAFETEFSLELPVRVRVRRDPDQRTCAAHYDSRHELTISQRAASSVMARELALHEYAHMRRFEAGHPSHTQDTDEAVFLAFAGREVERRRLLHCYQIANHLKDIYADDLTLAVCPPDKLVAFLESELARALADRPAAGPREGDRWTPASDPELTAINAAFALALLERHGVVERDHAIYDLAHAAARDAPHVDLGFFRCEFRDLPEDPSAGEFRRTLVDVSKRYVLSDGVASAAD